MQDQLGYKVFFLIPTTVSVSKAKQIIDRDRRSRCFAEHTGAVWLCKGVWKDGAVPTQQAFTKVNPHADVLHGLCWWPFNHRRPVVFSTRFQSVGPSLWNQSKACLHFNSLNQGLQICLELLRKRQYRPWRRFRILKVFFLPHYLQNPDGLFFFTRFSFLTKLKWQNLGT